MSTKLERIKLKMAVERIERKKIMEELKKELRKEIWEEVINMRISELLRGKGFLERFKLLIK